MRTRAPRSHGLEASDVLIDFPILTLIVFLPALGALVTYAVRSDRAARGVALAFSLVTLALATILLLGFLRTDWFSLPSLTTAGTPMRSAAAHRSPTPPFSVHHFPASS